MLLLPRDPCAGVPSSARPAVSPCVFCWISPSKVVGLGVRVLLHTSLGHFCLHRALQFRFHSLSKFLGVRLSPEQRHASSTSRSESEFVQISSRDAHSIRYGDVLLSLQFLPVIFVHRHDFPSELLTVLLGVVHVLSPGSSNDRSHRSTVFVSHAPPLFPTMISPVVVLTLVDSVIPHAREFSKWSSGSFPIPQYPLHEHHALHVC